jgi:hypothetical protein
MIEITDTTESECLDETESDVISTVTKDLKKLLLTVSLIYGYAKVIFKISKYKRV